MQINNNFKGTGEKLLSIQIPGPSKLVSISITIPMRLEWIYRLNFGRSD